MFFLNFNSDTSAKVAIGDLTPTGVMGGQGYFGDYAEITFEDVAATDVSLRGIKFTANGCMRCYDATNGVPSTATTTGGVAITSDGQLCVTFAAPDSATYIGRVPVTSAGAVHVEDSRFGFFAPLRTSVELRSGAGSSSFTRATVATVKDYDGAIRNCLSGEVRFQGQRRVRNLLTYTEDFSNAAWAATNVTKAAGELLATAANGTALHSYTAVAGDYVFSVELKRKTGTGNIQIAADSGTYTTVTLTSDWQRFSVQQTVAAGAKTAGIKIVTDTDAVYVRKAQLEYVQGQSKQNPSEYVSVGVLSSPFHGAMVDGVKYFDYENGNTVTDNVVTEARGAAISQTAAGYFPEAASTNLVLQSSNFGTTWTAVGTPTISAAAKYCGDIALDLIGDDDATALEGYTQTITFTGDAVKSVSFLIAQGTSTSTAVQLVDTTATANRVLGVVTWTAGVPTFTPTTGTVERAAEAMANGCYRIFIASSAVTAANTNSLRFYPATDAALAVGATGTVYIGGVQAENATVASSLIPTTTATVTRNADVLTYPIAGNFSATAGTIYAEYVVPFVDNRAAVDISDGTFGERYTINVGSAATNAQIIDGGVAQMSEAMSCGAVGTMSKTAISYQANDGAASTDGGTIVADTSMTLPTVTTIYVGDFGAGGLPTMAPIKNLRIAQTALTDAELVAITG